MLDIILNFIATFLKKTTTTTTLSPAMGTGSIILMQLGKIVFVSGHINITVALTNGDTLVTDLPPSTIYNPAFILMNSNTGGADKLHYGYVNNQNNVGTIRYSGSATASNRSFRFSFTYIAL